MMQGRTFFFPFFFLLQGKVSQCESNQASLNRSTKSGTKPSVLLQASTLETQQVANARAHEIDNMRIHLRLQDKWTDHCSTCGASRALAWAIMSTKSAASLLHRPPVSMPTTTSWQRPPSNSSEYFAVFSILARWSTARWCALRWCTGDLQQWSHYAA